MNDFLRAIEEELTGIPAQSLDGKVRLTDIPQLDSMGRLLIISRIEMDYGVTLSAEDFRNSATLADLYNKIQNTPTR